MRITFQLRFHTNFGQSLLLTGNHPVLGNGDLGKALPLQYLNETLWHLTIEFLGGAVPNANIVYNYVLRNPDGSSICDWGNDRIVNPAGLRCEQVLLVDSWNHAGFYENAFYTEPFQQVLLKGNRTVLHAPAPAEFTHTFKAKAPLLTKGQTLCLVGRGKALGDWSTTQPILLNGTPASRCLSARVKLGPDSFPLEYKYGVYDLEKKAFIRYEDGPNRVLNDEVAPNRQTVVNDGFAVLPATTWKGAGVAIPVFSLRSGNGFGVGEFTDLRLLADWCHLTGLRLIQVLPINDTIATHTWLDSYPYSAISAFALHPLYLNLERATEEPQRPWLEELEPERERLNKLDAVDYEAVIRAKMAFMRRIYPAQRGSTFASEGFRRFFEKNRHWLEPYAAFSFLRDNYGTPDFQKWPAYSRCSQEELDETTAEGSETYEGIALHYFIQYHLHRQLREAVGYAHSKGVILKGDIAIGVYRYGADVWEQPERYHTEVQAGAPPDPFAEKGQNWGFPTYNWPRMKEDGFAWWKRRFEQMAAYFDAFRIDHILGFFRIWSIPLDAVEGILGYFVPALPVRVEEFGRRGIRFDRDRFTRPFITEQTLWEVFGAATSGAEGERLVRLVKETFLEFSRRRPISIEAGVCHATAGGTLFRGKGNRCAKHAAQDWTLRPGQQRTGV